MCIPITTVLFLITTIILEVYPLCVSESVSVRYLGKPTSRPEIIPNSLFLKAVKGAHLWSTLTGATSGLTNSNRKKRSQKTQPSFLKRNFELAL